MCLNLPSEEKSISTGSLFHTLITRLLKKNCADISCDSDAGGIQVGTNIKASSEGEALHDPALHPQAAQDADQVPRPSVAQE